MASNPTAAAATTADALEVHVRMYRALGETETAGSPPKRPYQGLLGDCFLIRLVQGGQASHILIDCGMLMGSSLAEQRMQAIARDIVRTTGGSFDQAEDHSFLPKTPGKLDLLVVTHEHWDHISGFSQARGILLNEQCLKIGSIWMGWTEKDGDPQVARLRQRFTRTSLALNALAQRIDAPAAGAVPLADADQGGTLRSLQGFLGAAEHPGKKLQAREIMGALKAVKQPDYLEPGTVRNTPVAGAGAPSLRAFVLGPPRDETLLFKDKPSNGPARETYLDSIGLVGQIERFLAVDEAVTKAAADSKSAEGLDTINDADVPFGRKVSTILSRTLSAKVDKRKVGKAADLSEDESWLASHYFALQDIPQQASQTPAAAARCAAFETMQARRRVDDDWMAAAGPLALKLDSDTNNTSLVLAFDLPDGTAMLFAADAQVGNWESWHTRTYQDERGADHTAEQILNRTRFYKVGHHGSHNATLEKQGLEMMTRPDLVAAIPTDEEFGKQQGGGWQMPNPRVNAALTTRTGGRIIRNDRHYAAGDADIFGKHPASGLNRLTETDLYLEYRVL
ncbi:MBL fold metallo-hydrolase [Novosphingobium sp.]|uniref:MBL fold metallo-hydrolase n=1 Tax=Novosphingobium sp. TaxID=1874826 RepID=UPI0038BB26A9